LIECGCDLFGKAGHALTQSIFLRQVFPFADQRFTLGFKCTSPGIQFLSTTQQLVLLYKTGLIQIRYASALRSTSSCEPIVPRASWDSVDTLA